MGFSVAGVETGRFDTTGLKVTGNANVTSNIQINGTTILTSASLAQAANGAAAGPAYSFNSETTMGMLRSAAGILGFATASTGARENGLYRPETC